MIFNCLTGYSYSFSATTDNSSIKIEEKDYKKILIGKWRYCSPRIMLKNYIKNDDKDAQKKFSSLPDLMPKYYFIFFKDGKVFVNHPKDGFNISGSTSIREYKLEGNMLSFKMYKKNEKEYISSLKISFANNDEFNVFENYRGESSISKLFREK
jgi:hypothetical protein